jgi:hypothetical protein
MYKGTKNLSSSQDSTPNSKLCSFFNPPINSRNTKPSTEAAHISLAYKRIQSLELKSKTDNVRACPTKEERTEVKRATLPYIIPSGVFSKRGKAFLRNRSGLFCVDLDHVETDLQTLRLVILEKSRPVLMFRSPSGDGLKIIYSINVNEGQHEEYHEAFAQYFMSEFNQKVDPHGKSIEFACFLCFDPEAFYSDSPTEFGRAFIEKYISHGTPFHDDYQRGKTWLQKENIHFIEGNRHNYVAALAAFLNRVGMAEADALQKLVEFERSGFEMSEITGIVKGIFIKEELSGKAPLTQGKYVYITFPLRLLHLSDEHFRESVTKILNNDFEFSDGDIPTSIRKDYLIDASKGNLKPDLLRYLAACKSIIGTRRNFARTTWDFVITRMYGENSVFKPTKYSMLKLADEAMGRKICTRISEPGCHGFYISIRYKPLQLANEIKKRMSHRAAKKIEAQNAGIEISNHRKTLIANYNKYRASFTEVSRP